MKINLAAFATLLFAGFSYLPSATLAQTEASDANQYEFLYSAGGTQVYGRKVEDFRIGAVLNRMDGDDDTVVRVRQVLPDSPAAKAGLKAEDIVLQYGEAKIDSYESMMAAIKKYGDKQTNVRIKRDDEQLTLPIKATVAAGETAMELRLDGPQRDDRSDQKNKDQQKDVAKDVAKDKAIDVAKKIIATKIIGKDGVVKSDIDDGQELQLRWIQKGDDDGQAQVIVLSPEQDLKNGKIRIAVDELKGKAGKAKNVEMKVSQLRIIKPEESDGKTKQKSDSPKIDQDLFRALRVRLGKMDKRWSVFSSEFEALQRRVRRLEEAFKQSHSTNSDQHEARMDRERHEAEMQERREQEMREAEMRERHEMELRERREAEMRERREIEMRERERNQHRENEQSQRLMNRVEQQEQRINQLQQQLRRLNAEMDQFRKQIEERNRIPRLDVPRPDLRRPQPPTPGRPPVPAERPNDRGANRDQPGVPNPYRTRQSDRPQQTRPNQDRPQQDRPGRTDRPSRPNAQKSDAANQSDRKPSDRKDSEILRSFQQQRIQMQRRSRRGPGNGSESDRRSNDEVRRSTEDRPAIRKDVNKNDRKQKPESKRVEKPEVKSDKQAKSEDLSEQKMLRAKEKMEAARAAQAKAMEMQKEISDRNKEMVKQQIEKAKARALEARKRVEAQMQAVKAKAAEEKAAAEAKQKTEQKKAELAAKDKDANDKKAEAKKKIAAKKDAVKKEAAKKKKPKKEGDKSKDEAKAKDTAKAKEKNKAKEKEKKDEAKASIPVKPIRPTENAK